MNSNNEFEEELEKKSVMGRPRQGLLTKEEWDVFEKLCQIQCTEIEIAGWFGISEDTLNRRCKEKYELTFAETYKNYSADGKISLRRMQYKTALKGNTGMLIWLGKQELGQRDKRELTGEGGKPIQMDHTVKSIDFSKLTDEELMSLKRLVESQSMEDE